MASLLSTVTSAPAAPSYSSYDRKRKSSPDIPSSEGIEPSSEDSTFFSRKRYGESDDDEPSSSRFPMKPLKGKKPRVSDVTVTPGYEPENDYSMEVDDVQVKAEPMDDEEEDELDIKVQARPLAQSARANGAAPARRRMVNSTSVKVVKPEPVTVKAEPDASPVKPSPNPRANGKPAPPGSTHWSNVQDALVAPKSQEFDEAKASFTSVKVDSVLEADGSLRMFWLDFMEQDGIVHLVGKVLDKQSKKHVSACVTINGIQRNLFVKPRPKRFCTYP